MDGLAFPGFAAWANPAEAMARKYFRSQARGRFQLAGYMDRPADGLVPILDGSQDPIPLFAPSGDYINRKSLV